VDHVSAFIGVDDPPLIAYYDYDHGLTGLRPANAFFAPYFRRPQTLGTCSRWMVAVGSAAAVSYIMKRKAVPCD
jgi:hypothetical protein